MRTVIRLLILFFVLCGHRYALAAETTVEPGDGTLLAAVTAASSGDTLILRDGSYYGNYDSANSSYLTIDKSLTIRAISREAEPVVTGGGFIAINGTDIEVTLQGLVFDDDLSIMTGIDVKVLENTFLDFVDISCGNYKTSEGDGSLSIIGNHLIGGVIRGIYSDNAYIAGNTLDDGYITAYVPVWIVGNVIKGDTSSEQKIYISTSGSVRVIGNRITAEDNTSSASDGIYIFGSESVIVAGNIVEISDAPSSSYCNDGIYTSGTGNVRILNNVLYRYGTHTTESGAGIVAEGLVSGNIVSGWKSDAIPVYNGSTVTNNICFNNTTNCGTANGNLEADPAFADTVDFRLGSSSPGIDAGPEAYQYADLNRSRNDIGAYGGPWSIEQYDRQREPDRLSPYVFPLFDALGNLNLGQLEVRALGVARLR